MSDLAGVVESFVAAAESDPGLVLGTNDSGSLGITEKGEALLHLVPGIVASRLPDLWKAAFTLHYGGGVAITNEMLATAVEVTPALAYEYASSSRFTWVNGGQDDQVLWAAKNAPELVRAAIAQDASTMTEYHVVACLIVLPEAVSSDRLSNIGEEFRAQRDLLGLRLSDFASTAGPVFRSSMEDNIAMWVASAPGLVAEVAPDLLSRFAALDPWAALPALAALDDIDQVAPGRKPGVRKSSKMIRSGM